MIKMHTYSRHVQVTHGPMQKPINNLAVNMTLHVCNQTINKYKTAFELESFTWID